MAGSATIIGKQHYVAGIGHPSSDPSMEASPAMVITNQLTGGVSLSFVAGPPANVGWDLGGQVWLLPSGGDDTVAVETWVKNSASTGLIAMFGPGDFILTDQMVWRSRRVMGKWGNKGIGLKVQGCGAGNTRFYYSGPSGMPMVSVDAPDSAGIGKRNYLTEIGGMSWLRATAGTTEVADGTTDGMAFYGVPSTAGEVLHTTKFKDLVVDGFDFPFTLSDSTLAEFDTVWCVEFLHGLRLGFNVDMLRIRHSMFGSEQFGFARNDSIAIKDNFEDGHNPPGNNDHIHVESTWFMKIGLGFDLSNKSSVIIGDGSYFEQCRQIFNSENNTSSINLKINGTNMNMLASNDDPAYPKFSFGQNSVLALTVGPGNTSGSFSPTAGWFALRSNNTDVNWLGNNIFASGVGNSVHLRFAKTGEEHVRKALPRNGAGTYHFSGPTGLSKKVGGEIPVTVATTGTITTPHTDGDAVLIGPMTGNITIHPASNTPVNPDDGTVMTYIIQANGTTPSAFTVTWGSNFGLPVAFVQPGAGDALKRTVLQFRRQNSRWHQIGSGNTWMA